MKECFIKFYKKSFKERGSPLFRKLDKYVGVFLLLVLSFFRRKKRFPQEIQKIGIIKLAGIGDTVILARSIYALRKKFPEKEILFFSGKENQEMAALLPVNRVIPVSAFSVKNTLKLIRGEKLDVLIDAEPWSRITALWAFFSQAKYTIGFHSFRQYKHFCFDQAAFHLKTRHEVHNGFSLFEKFQLEKPFAYPFLEKREKTQEKIVVFHPHPGGSWGTFRKWPTSYWRKLFSLLSPTGYTVYVTGSSRDRLSVEEIFSFLPIHNVAGKISLQETAKLLARATCVVSVNTGIMHLAAALNTPTFCLHGPTDPNRWGALGEKVYSFSPLPLDHSCLHFGFEKICDTCKCMEQIYPEKVFEKIKPLLVQ